MPSCSFAHFPVCPFPYVSICPFAHLTIYLFVHFFICIFTHLSINPFAHSPICLLVYQSINLFVCSFHKSRSSVRPFFGFFSLIRISSNTARCACVLGAEVTPRSNPGRAGGRRLQSYRVRTEQGVTQGKAAAVLGSGRQEAERALERARSEMGKTLQLPKVLRLARNSTSCTIRARLPASDGLKKLPKHRKRKRRSRRVATSAFQPRRRLVRELPVTPRVAVRVRDREVVPRRDRGVAVGGGGGRTRRAF